MSERQMMLFSTIYDRWWCRCFFANASRWMGNSINKRRVPNECSTFFEISVSMIPMSVCTLTYIISWHLNLKKASTGSSITPIRYLFYFSHTGNWLRSTLTKFTLIFDNWRSNKKLDKIIWRVEKTTILPKMQAVLVDWLIQVYQQFNSLQVTLYLTVAILDWFLQDHVSNNNDNIIQRIIKYIA